MSEKFTLSAQNAKGSIVKEVDGIEMGVLPDGTPYLTGRGLARVCGVAPSAIIRQKDEWNAGNRTGKLAKLLLERGFNEPILAPDLTVNGQAINAYNDRVAMAILEYYAFEAVGSFTIAQANYRRLAQAGLRLFIYTALGYAPTGAVPPEWKAFHDRLLLHTVPPGYFSVFQEMSSLVLTGIRAGLKVDAETVPDISVGKVWGNYWNENDLEDKYGARMKHPHEYPDYFPQAVSNPQEMNIYPVDALPEFRRFMQEVYLPEKFPTYLQGKVSKQQLAPSTKEILLAAVLPKELEE